MTVSHPVRSHPVRDDGLWFEELRSVDGADRILYCDRDGVIIHDRHYLSDPAGVELIDGIVEILAAAEAAGVPAVIVTNQSGIGRGYFDWDAFAAVQMRMLDLLAQAGVGPSVVLACPHHPEAQPPYRHPNPPMRKPNPGMLLIAAELYRIDPAASLMIGDKPDDMAAAARAGLHHGILVGGKTAPETAPEAASRSILKIDTVGSIRPAIPLVKKWIARERR